MKYLIQLTILSLLYLIINKFQTCKSEFHVNNEGAISMESFLNNFIKFYLYDKKIVDHKYVEKSFKNLGLFDNNTWNLIKQKQLPGLNEDKMNYIQNFYKTLIYYHNFYQSTSECITNKTYKIEEKKMCAQEIINETSIYRKSLSSIIPMYILPDGKDQPAKVFDVLLEILETRKASKVFSCSMNTESIQMAIRNFLGIIIFVMMENYALVSYTYRFFYPKLLRTQNSSGRKNTNDSKLIEILDDDTQKVLFNLQNDISSITKVAFLTRQKSSTDIQRCDPSTHVLDVTYQHFTNFIQGWVGSEEHLNKEKKCGTKCAFQQTKFYSIPRTEKDKSDATVGDFDERLIYNGTLHDCKVAPFFNFIYKQIEPPDSERMYHHFANEKEDEVIMWGKDDQSRDQVIEKLPIKSIRHSFDKRTKEGTKPCKICLCQLERDNPESIKAFSGTPVSVPFDRVVTGIRWVIKNNTVFLELRGTEFTNHFLDFTSTSTWYTQYGKNHGDEFIFLDYNKRSLWLDDIIIPDNMFITGAKFVEIAGIISLSVHQVLVDRNGTIIHNSGSWYRHVDPEKHTTELMLNRPDSSEFAPNDNAANKEVSTPGRTFIKFQPTDFRKDASQTTVPYLDIQEVVTEPPTPLQGIGVYYKGTKGFGGFIGLKIFTADIAGKFINKEFLNKDFQTIDSFLKYVATK